MHPMAPPFMRSVSGSSLVAWCGQAARSQMVHDLALGIIGGLSYDPVDY